jgi:hypothetical protein
MEIALLTRLRHESASPLARLLSMGHAQERTAHPAMSATRPKRCALFATMHATPSEALQALEHAFNKAHVFVTEAHQLGGLALVVHWDMEADHRQLLVDAVVEASIDLDESAFEALRGPWEGELSGSLHVTLEHEGRDSKVPVPAVPG